MYLLENWTKLAYICVNSMFKLLIGFIGVIVILFFFPFINIRIGFLKSSRIGHYLIETQLAVLQNQYPKKFLPRIYFDIWFDNRLISNTCIQKYWKKELRVWNRQLIAPIYTVLKSLKFPQNFFIDSVSGDRDVKDSLKFLKAPKLFDHIKSSELRNQLTQIGLPENAKFICFHHRDSAYLTQKFPNEDYSYHSYRDTSLANYVLGLKKLADRGYYIIRMGQLTNEILSPSISPKIIDYANTDLQSDEIDVFLISECEYFISNSSGIDALASFFKKPILFLNFPNFSYIATWQSNIMYSFKKFVDLNNSTELKLEEIFARRLHGFLRTKDFEANGITLIENNSEENMEYMTEFDDHFSKNWIVESEILSEREMKFWQIFPFEEKLHPSNVHRCKISKLYLENRILIEKSN